MTEKNEELPESLKNVLGDYDVTEELKRRLELKRMLPRQVKPDCECKELSDDEMIAAVKASHDMRTGKVKSEDIQSSLAIHPALIEAAVCAPVRGDIPLIQNSLSRKMLITKQKKLQEDVEEDLKLSKKVVESLIEEKLIEASRRSAALEIMDNAMARERDKGVVFVPVTGLDPRDAAKRVIRLKNEFDDVEPVDLTGVLDNVNPICDVHIDKLQGVMNVRKACLPNGLPDEIRFTIPNKDLPDRTGVQPNGTYVPPVDPEDVKFALTRYVHFDSMPPELQSVVRSYLSLRRGIDSSASQRFKNAVSELADKAEATFNDGPEVI